jgi:hypothetical protein
MPLYKTPPFRSRSISRFVCHLLMTVLAWSLLVAGSAAIGQEKAEKPTPSAAVADPEAKAQSLVRLARSEDVWVDPKRKLVVVDGEVVLREGLLEMFACPKGTKEHESIIAINGKAKTVHAGLLAVGAVPGSPVQFHPEYRPATGMPIEITILWVDKDGKRHRTRAQEWVQHVETKKPMEHPWVFAGSGFFTDETTGERYYYGDAGDFICVSNFSSATLDLPIKSLPENANLLFAPFTERIPPLGTKVRLVLVPQLEKKKKPTQDETKPVDGKPEDG